MVVRVLLLTGLVFTFVSDLSLPFGLPLLLALALLFFFLGQFVVPLACLLGVPALLVFDAVEFDVRFVRMLVVGVFRISKTPLREIRIRVSQGGVVPTLLGQVFESVD